MSLKMKVDGPISKSTCDVLLVIGNDHKPICSIFQYVAYSKIMQIFVISSLTVQSH